MTLSSPRGNLEISEVCSKGLRLIASLHIFSKFEGPAFKDSWSCCTICLLSVPAPRIFWHALPPPLLPCLSIEEESDPEISRIYFNIHEWSQANHVQRVSQAVWLYLQYMFAFAREITIKIVPLQIQFCSMWCAKKLGTTSKTRGSAQHGPTYILLISSLLSWRCHVSQIICFIYFLAFHPRTPSL
jgi:hypothetical protein